MFLALVGGVVLGLPFIFGQRRWVRVVSVLVLLGTATVAWTGVVTSHRLAIEEAGVSSSNPQEHFVQGAFATRNNAVQMQNVFWVSVLGLAILALIPPTARRGN